MAVKASVSITLSFMVDVKAVYRYYKLQASTASAPSVPTTATPSGWTDAEPTYTEGSTNTLYTVDKTVFTNDTFLYSAVSKSTSYEAAKAAYNKAVAATNTANSAKDTVDNLEIGGRNLVQYTNTEKSVVDKWSSWGAAILSMDNGWLKCSYDKTNSSLNYAANSTKSFDFVSGQEYTLSFDIYATKSISINYCYIMSAEGNISLTSVVNCTATTTSQRYSVTFTKTTSRSNCGVMIGTSDSNALAEGTSFYIRRIKLEKGNKATDWTPAPEDVYSDISNDKPLINGTHTAASYTWTGVAPFAELKDGQKITYWLPFTPTGTQVNMPYWKDAAGATQQSTNNGAVLNLTLSDGTTTGNIACFLRQGDRITTHFCQGSAIELTYKKLVKIGSYYYTGWWANANYWSDTIDNRLAYFTGKTGTKGIWATSFFMEDGLGRYQNICTASDGTVTTSNRTTATTKKANTIGFKVGSTIYYSNTSYNANTNINGWGVIYSGYGNLIDSRYSLNTTLTANSLLPYTPIYLVGTIGSDSLFYLDETWWTQTATNTEKVYVLVGSCYNSDTSSCRITLYEQNPWYVYDGEKLQNLTQELIDRQTTNLENYKVQVQTDIENLDGQITTKFTATEKTISDVASSANDQFNEISKYIRFNLNGIEIGSTESSLKLILDNDIIRFSNNGEDIGTWDGTNFRTGNMYVDVNERAQFGNFAFVPRSDGSLMFLKVGG